jgi:hypothetical protein
MGAIFSSTSLEKGQHQEHQTSGNEVAIFYAQKYSWDCGIAVLIMAQRWAGDVSYHPPEKILNAHSPLWTIEILEQLLLANSLNCKMYTLSVGVEPHHREITWYNTNNMKDNDRIESVFQRSVAEKWPVIKVLISFTYFFRIDKSMYSYVYNMYSFQSSIPLSDIIQSLREQCIVIVLVDAKTLRTGDSSSRTDFSSTTLPTSTNSDEYAGHFILLISYTEDTRHFAYLDPSRRAETLLVSEDNLDSARCHIGTDQDIILCFSRQK